MPPDRSPIGDLLADMSPGAREIVERHLASAVVLICGECTGRWPSDALVMVFPDDEIRDRWWAEHRDGTGHRERWDAAGLDYRQAIAAYTRDRELRDTLREGRTPADLPLVADVVDRLREVQAHPEWTGPTLRRDEVTALLADLDDARAAREQRDGLAALWWRPAVPHDVTDVGRTAVLRYWADLRDLLYALPDPHRSESG